MNKKLNIFTGLLVMLYPLGLDLYLVAAPEMSFFFHTNDKEVGSFFGVYLIGVAISLVIAGKCSDFYGSRHACVFGCIVSFFASLYCTSISERELTNFLWARFFQGFGSGICYITAQSLVRKNYLTRDLRIRAYARLNGISCTVPIIAPSLGAMLITKGWQLIFLFISFFSAILLALSYYLIDQKNERRLETGAGRGYFSVSFITMIILSSISLGCVFFYVSSSSVILIDKLNVKIDAYAVWMGLLALFSVCTSLLLSSLRKIFSDFLLLRMSAFLMFVTGAFIIYQNNYESLTIYLIVFCLISIINAITFSISLGYALEPFGDNSGEAAGVLHTVQLIFTGIVILFASWTGVYVGKILVYFLAMGGLISLMAIQYHQWIFNKNGD